MPDMCVCYLSVSATFHGFKKKKTTQSVVKELVLPYNISVVGHLMLVQHKNSLKRRQDSSVVQESDSIKYKQPKKK